MYPDVFKLLKKCSLCPRKCGVNRFRGEKGFCRAGINPVVYAYIPHFGEEPVISGKRGSGTIFFSNCTLRCVYCQNYKFSQLGEGKEVSIKLLAQFMLELQDKGCHNINLVTPTHYIPQILKAISIAISKGLHIPIIYNTSGYESVETLTVLDGIVDIYLPDIRYGDDRSAERYSYAPNYTQINQEAIKEMYRQVGEAKIDKEGAIRKGLIVRHLVLPNNLADTEMALSFIAKNLSKSTYVSLMSQYFPYHLAKDLPELARRVTAQEYDYAVELLDKYGLHNGWIQEERGLDSLAGVNIESTLRNTPMASSDPQG